MPEYKLHLGDCVDVMRCLPDSSVDLIATDPPYLTTDLRFDKNGLDMAWVSEAVRVVKPNGYLAVFSPVEMQAEIAKVWKMRFSGAWVKEKGGMRTASAKKPMNQWELYCVYAHPLHKVKDLTWNKTTYPSRPYSRTHKNTGYKRCGKDQLDRANSSAWTKDGYVSVNNGFRFYTDVIFAPSKRAMQHHERTNHPTQKPIKVMSVIIQWTTNANDVVLDPFAGSGTTGVAAIGLGRNFVGVEREPEYLAIAERRLSQAAAQLRIDNA